MTSLIACVGVGKGTWVGVAQLMSASPWDHIFVVTNEFGREKFSHEVPHTTILVADGASVQEMTRVIQSALAGKIADTEVAVSLLSGSGAEHMAVLSAVLKSGLGVRLVIPVAGPQGVSVVEP